MTSDPVQPRIVMAMTHEVPIACSLQPDALRGQLGEWQRLLEHVVDRTVIEHGIRLGMSPDTPLAELTRLVVAEQRCCQFLRFAITVDTRGLGLEISAPDDARPIVEALFGAAAPAA